MTRMGKAGLGALMTALLGLAGCQGPVLAPVALVPRVDLQRYMGDWYVIAHIPSYFERDAYNAVESYRLEPDGSIATEFRFREGAFDGAAKTMHPRGFVVDRESNAVWGMRFIWPINADYRISLLSDDYRMTVVAREKRDYVWIMARTPSLPEADYQRLLAFVAAQGYDLSKVRKVPQQWN